MSASLTSVRLEYAPTSDRAPLGGVFFKPSYQSLLLLLVAALSILWLVRRHAPWRLFAEIPADQWLSTNPLVTPDHHLLVADRQTGLVLYDLSTGKPIRTVFPSLNLGSAYIALNGGRRIAVFTRKAPTIAVYDTSTAELVAQLPNPCPDASFQLSPDGKRMATPVPKTGEVLIWDLTSNLPVSQMQPMKRVASYSLWVANGGRDILNN